MTDKDNWPAIEALLQECLDLPAAQRQAYLDAQAPNDTVRTEVLQLLQSVESDTAAVLGARPKLLSSTEVENNFSPCDRVGPYTLREKIASGGMGDVWRAQRHDGSVKRAIALKLPRVALLDSEYQKRLIREAELLSTLVHPNITRLYDAGFTDDKQPFMALELVSGQDITRYCSSQQLRLEHRLQLFLQVVDAVHFAHRHLIIHRDLKPSNILVTDEGQAKLLDFGIATLLEPGNETSGDITRAHGRAFTPAYAAPEQFTNAPVTVAADVYSLGVLLFELLTGKRPFPERENQLAPNPGLGDAPAASRSIQPGHHEQLRLKTERQLRGLLNGDLDAILQKALHKDSEQRYSGADELAADIRASLANRPIQAKPISPGQRLYKFVRRNPLSSGLALLTGVVIVAAFVLVNWQAREALLAAQRAEIAANESNAVLNFLTMDLLAAADPKLGGNPDVGIRTLIDRAATRVDQRTNTTPRVTATVHQTLGEAYIALGDYTAAKQEFQRAHDLTTNQGLDELHLRAISGLAEAAIGQQQHEQADEHLQHFKALASTQWNDTHPLWLKARTLEGILLHHTGAYEDAASQLYTVVQQTRDGEHRRADTYHLAGEWLGINLTNQGRFAEAVDVVQQLQADLKTEYGPAHPRTLLSSATLGAVMRENGQLDAAKALLQDVIPPMQAAFGADHEVTQTTLFELGRTYVLGEDYAAGTPLLREVHKSFKHTHGPGHEFSMLSGNILAVSLERSGQNHAAATIHQQLSETATATLGPLHPHTLIYRSNAARATLFMTPSDPELAWERIQAVIQDAEKTFSESDYQMGLIFRSAGEILIARKAIPQAISMFEASAANLEPVFGPDSVHTRKSMDMLKAAQRSLSPASYESPKCTSDGSSACPASGARH